MNIFILDENPKLNALYHTDKHVVKMILEHVQMMSTILREEGYEKCYKSTHKNHPSTIWLRESLDNWFYLFELTKNLNEEFLFRFDKKENHKSFDLMMSFPIPKNLKKKGLTEFAMVMPDVYKIDGYPVDSYRNYYRMEKRDILKYTKREIPYWIGEEE